MIPLETIIIIWTILLLHFSLLKEILKFEVERFAISNQMDDAIFLICNYANVVYLGSGNWQIVMNVLV